MKKQASKVTPEQVKSVKAGARGFLFIEAS